MLPCNIQHDVFGTNHFINESHPGPKSRRVLLARTWKSVRSSTDAIQKVSSINTKSITLSTQPEMI